MSALQGQGSPSRRDGELGALDLTSTNSPQKREVLAQMPDSVKQEIAQNNMVQLKLQNRQQSLLSSTDLQFQNILAVNHQGMSNLSASSYRSKYQCYSRFFIIKSFTEEDVHKAIKYNVWSSTVGGNAILDQALADVKNFKDTMPKDLDKNSDGQSEDDNAKDAEVYLMFSVNKSKHFCGVAKMASHVRNDVRHDQLWKQQGKWPGSISIDWLHVKDIPNT